MLKKRPIEKEIAFGITTTDQMTQRITVVIPPGILDYLERDLVKRNLLKVSVSADVVRICHPSVIVPPGEQGGFTTLRDYGESTGVPAGIIVADIIIPTRGVVRLKDVYQTSLPVTRMRIGGKQSIMFSIPDHLKAGVL